MAGRTIHTAAIAWNLGQSDFLSGRYSRAHEWRFDGGARIPAAASPHVVRPTFTDASAVDPEEAFVAALASCHMLFFLALAAKEGLVVERYTDEPEGTLEFEDGNGQMTSVHMRPAVVLRDEISSEALGILHAKAHAVCFLARSVTCAVTWELEAPRL